jgi:hypothetical protein
MPEELYIGFHGLCLLSGMGAVVVSMLNSTDGGLERTPVPKRGTDRKVTFPADVSYLVLADRIGAKKGELSSNFGRSE